MAASLPHFNALFKPSFTRIQSRKEALQVKAQSSRDEGRIGGNENLNNVDANLKVLRDRMEKIRMKERLERCCCRSCDHQLHGWNYVASGYDYESKRAKDLIHLFQLLRVIGGTMGFTCLCGSAFVCLVSILVNFNH